MTDFLVELGPAPARAAAIERALRTAVVERRLVAGTRLPSTRQLARELGCARATVVAAYEQLVAEGYLVSAQGSGTTVAQNRAPTDAISVHAARTIEEHPGRIDFVPGEPDLGSFPRQAWTASVRSVMSGGPDGLLGYGDPRGLPVLRDVLAAYLARSRAVVADPSRIVVFSGFGSALSNLAATFSDLGVDRIAVEDPGLPPMVRALAAGGPNVVPVPVHQEGLSVEHLRGERAVLCTPAHQYPTGVVLSPGRRAALIEHARATGGWIIEDDYDGEFRYDTRPLGAMQGLDPDRVVYGGTASKILAPGVGIAWLILPSDLVDAVTQTKRDRQDAVSPIVQAVLADFIASGRLDRHLRAQRRSYRRRRDDLLRVLSETAPFLETTGISAGLHVTAQLLDREERDVIDAAARRSVVLLGLGSHRIAEPIAPGLVLGYSRSPGHAFPQALRDLAAILGSLVTRPGPSGPRLRSEVVDNRSAAEPD